MSDEQRAMGLVAHSPHLFCDLRGLKGVRKMVVARAAGKAVQMAVLS
jgi:hypothetical protein